LGLREESAQEAQRRPSGLPPPNLHRRVLVAALLLTLLVAVILAAVRSSPAPPPGVVSLSSTTAAVSKATVSTGAMTPTKNASPEEWKKTLAAIESLLENDAQNRELLAAKALALYNLGRLDDARSLLDDLLAKSENAQLRARLGNILRDRGDLVGAEAAYRRALAEDPKLPGPYVDLAELRWRQGRPQDALDLLATGLRTVAVSDRGLLETVRKAVENQGTGTSAAAGRTTSTTALSGG
jgi:predicted Zn-dependent protease